MKRRLTPAHPLALLVLQFGAVALAVIGLTQRSSGLGGFYASIWLGAAIVYLVTVSVPIVLLGRRERARPLGVLVALCWVSLPLFALTDTGLRAQAHVLVDTALVLVLLPPAAWPSRLYWRGLVCGMAALLLFAIYQGVQDLYWDWGTKYGVDTACVAAAIYALCFAVVWLVAWASRPRADAALFIE